MSLIALLCSLVICWIECNSSFQVFAQSHVTTPTLLKKPTIIAPPVDVFSAEGVLEFSCQASGVPKPVINWYHAETGNLVIDQTPSGGSLAGIHVNQHYGRLMISNPIRDTIYSFYCNASNAAGWAISEPPVRGALAYLENKFHQEPVDKTVAEGSRVILECMPPKGMPPPSVYWLRDGKRVTLSNVGNMKVTPQGHLEIAASSVRDSGDYNCVAKNAAGEHRSSSAKLYVQPRIRFSETPKDIRVRQGSDVKFRCRTEGDHLVQWSKDQGRGTIDSSRAELTEGFLLLRNVQQSDSGTYICTAPGNMAAHAVLTVETPPTFSRTPDDLTVYVGQTARFHCVTSGFPKPSIYWELADKTPLFPSDENEVIRLNKRYYLHRSGSLEIRDVQQSDAGRYQCTAHSSVDRIHSSAMLQVLPRPSQLAESEGQLGDIDQRTHHPLVPIIGLPPANQTREVGDLVILDCELGIKRPEVPSGQNFQALELESSTQWTNVDWAVTWHLSNINTRGTVVPLKYANPHDAQRYSFLPGGSLQIFNAQPTDTGAYVCTAQAVYHRMDGKPIVLQSNWTAYLNIQPKGSVILTDKLSENPSSPPRNVRVINITDTTVTLTWDSSHWGEFSSTSREQFNLASLAFWVEYYRPDLMEDGWQIVEQNWQATVMKIGNLQPDTVYYFLIRPRLVYGRVGWASAPLGPVLTLPGVAHLRPKNFTKTLVNKEIINAVKNIELKAVQLKTLTPHRVKVSWSLQDRPEIVSLLSGYTIYYRKVSILQCITVSMNGQREEMIESPYSAEDYCSLKLNDAYNRIQQLQQLRKKGSPSSNTIQNVEIKTHFPLSDSLVDSEQPMTFERSGLVRELHPFSCYEFSVKANIAHELMGKIEGRESISKTILTFESFPNAPPSEIAAQWISDEDIELRWNLPPATDWNGLLISFIVYVYDESATHHETFNVSHGERRTRIRGLLNKVTYMIQMAAVTCKGVGIRSEPLKLDPKFRKKGLGVGFGFDKLTGEKSYLASGRNLSNKQGPESVTMQPWFIILLASSLVLWCALILLVVYCCRRQRFNLSKSTRGVLIANTSNGGSTSGDPSTIHGNSIVKMTKSKDDTLNISLKPLIPKADNSEQVQTSYTFTYPTDDQNAYGLYSVANGEAHWPINYTSDTIPNRARLYCTTLGENENVAAYQGRDMLNRISGVDMMNIPNGGCCNGAVNSGSINYVSNCSPILSNYLTYQPKMFPLSQSVNEFHPPDSQSVYPANMGQCPMIGLPMIAPVARLANHPSQFTHENPSPLLGSMEPSATPYATASIVKPRFPSQHQSMKLTGTGEDHEESCISRSQLCNGLSRKHEAQLCASNGSYSPSEGSASYASNYNDSNVSPYVDGGRTFQSNDLHMVHQTNVRGMERQMNGRKPRASTPLRTQNMPMALDVRTLSSNNSKSDSAGSNKTLLSDTSGVQRVKNPALSSPITSQVNYCPEGSVYSLIDDSIPPPPASPPPPAPAERRSSHTANSLYQPKGSTVCQFSKPNEEMTIYDTDAETSDNESALSNDVRGAPAPLPSNLPAFNQTQAPFHVQIPADNSRSTTYAHVY